uniref:Alcohol dehydrogenase iron-type/glycerol dehydrogenase GldA domain-containing protein n=1 Tax=Erythrolobus australicus TaxID=1077150 RepID=A0A7S1XHQ4_9RHOD|mmetsp:Transcript_5008/g.13499  ORF Transcript_5008/g.13499 Transcript_5008/m.13499 type:complete len:374 (+) Transcript_5008:27-1148(+)|eukprot:CAMPEP_0185833638 /NCGR_PEP_ID=MMETSP1353-20130828/3291_1 /TAXON_ID=1077150 /ORGANISM="Erythrolobus australicus, Strain CCMP3124" /LENGTH=373 /DNA_ID=CAMNT_0028531953 /DNA_START=17 /DNA_END=1138 /DNA_ORIENTATION=+
MDERRVTQTCFPGRYIQGPDALGKIPSVVGAFGGKALMIADPFVADHVLPEVKHFFSGAELVIEKFGGECTDAEIKRLADTGSEAGCNSVIGFGGGKTLDTSKAVSFYMKSPVVIVPTLASTDAPCSARAVIYTESGEVVRYLDLPRNPDVVLLDTKLIVKAPVRFLISGIGDALSTWFEAESCMAKGAANSTCGAGHQHPGSMTSYALAKLCYDTLKEYGVLAVSSAKSKACTPAFEKIVEANTLLSGLGFESGGLGAAHAIHNGLSELSECHKFMHGEKVAFGVLAGLFFTDKGKDVIDEVYTLCESVGLPTTLADLGISEVTDEKLEIVAKRTCVEEETIHNELKPGVVDSVIQAIRAADSEGRRRKGSK